MIFPDKLLFKLTILKSLLVISFFVSVTNISGQNVRWENNYGGSANETLKDFIQTSDGGFLSIGFSNSNSDQIIPTACQSSFGENAWIVKTTSSLGQVSWAKPVGGSSRDYAYTGVENNGGFVIGGKTNSDDCDLVNESAGAWLFKLNQSGDLQWSYSYQNPSNPRIYSIEAIASNTNNTQLLIGANDNSGGARPAWLFSVSSEGIKNNIIDENIPETFIKGIKSSGDGGFIVYGLRSKPCNGVGLSSNDIWIRKLDNNYNTVWDQVIGDVNQNDRIVDLEVKGTTISVIGLSDICYIPTLQLPNSTQRNLPIFSSGNWGFHMDANGSIGQVRTIDVVGEMSATSDGGWLITTSQSEKYQSCLLGICNDPRIFCLISQFDPLYYAFKTDFDWKVLDYNSYGGLNSERPERIIQISDGGTIIAGISNSESGLVSDNYGQNDYWLLEIDAFENSDTYCKVKSTTFLSDIGEIGNPNTYLNFIENFTIGIFSNNSDNDGGYGNFVDQIITLEPGSTVPFSMTNISGDFVNVIYPANKFAIWVDWNNDGDFEEDGELQVYDIINGNTNGNFVVPATAQIGDKLRMRIGTFAGQINGTIDGNSAVLAPAYPPNPCYACFFGEYEDYTVVIDLIPEISCQFSTATLTCDYQHRKIDYPIFFNLPTVNQYLACSDKLLDGQEQCWEFFPDKGATQATINLINVGGGDVDLIILNKLNEKTGIVGCSQNNGSSNESVTFDIDPSVSPYHIVVDAPAETITSYYLQVDCNQNFDCIYGVSNDNLKLAHMGIDNECYDLAFNKSMSGMSGETKTFYIQLSDFNNDPINNDSAANSLRMWVDANGDGDYYDDGEFFHNATLNYFGGLSANNSFTLPNLSVGTYKCLLQIYTLEDPIDVFEDPCLFWFNGGSVEEIDLNIIESINGYCPSYGCTYCPASGGETIFLEEFSWGNVKATTGDNGGYIDNSNFFLKTQVGFHPEINFIAQDNCSIGNRFRIWLDVDNNKDFNGFFEKIYDSSTPVISANTNQFIAALPVGTYQMRIQYESETVNSPDPCATNFSGETEDYTLIICADINDCPSPPVAGFMASTTQLFEGESIDFSYALPASILSSGIDTSGLTYNWQFSGGAPSSSAQKEPTIAYNTAGAYDVMLTVSNDDGLDTKMKSLFVNVFEASSKVTCGCDDIVDNTPPTLTTNNNAAWLNIGEMDNDTLKIKFSNYSEAFFQGSDFIATDNCDDLLAVNFSGPERVEGDGFFPGSCYYKDKYKWTVIDECGNLAADSIFVKVLCDIDIQGIQEFKDLDGVVYNDINPGDTIELTCEADLSFYDNLIPNIEVNTDICNAGATPKIKKRTKSNALVDCNNAVWIWEIEGGCTAITGDSIIGELKLFFKYTDGNNCVDNLSVLDNPIPSKTYEAVQTIVSNGQINADSVVTFKAGNAITLQNGFHAQTGSSFTAKIASVVCNNQAVARSNDEPEDINKIERTHLKVYPNPASDRITIEFSLSEPTAQLIIYNLDGRRVENHSIKSSEQYLGHKKIIVDTSNLPAGFYYIALKGQQTQLNKKIIIVK